MRPKQQTLTQRCDLFRARLEQIINLKHERVQLAGKIDWAWFDSEIAPLYSDKGRPGSRPALLLRSCFSNISTGSPTRACASAGSRIPTFSTSPAKSFFVSGVRGMSSPHWVVQAEC